MNFLRHELDKFSTMMELKLRANDEDKGDSWKTCKREYLIESLMNELDEFLVKENKDELIDIANFCMFLYYREKS